MGAGWGGVERDGVLVVLIGRPALVVIANELRSEGSRDGEKRFPDEIPRSKAPSG